MVSPTRYWNSAGAQTNPSALPLPHIALYKLNTGIGIVGCSGNPSYAIRFNKTLDIIGTYIKFPKPYSEFVVDPIWYDPMLAIPLNSDSISDPIALQCAFYFNTPVNLKLKADLKDANGKVIASRDIDINNSVIAIADFSCEYVGVDRFAQGNYTVELIYDGEVFAKTDDPLTVR